MSASLCQVVVLISGYGSNLQAIIDAGLAAADSRNFEISAVISNKSTAFGLQRAEQSGIPAQTIDNRNYPSREEFDLALIKVIDNYKPDLIVLAGFMRILSSAFVQHYSGKILNIHPSLLPKYPGTNTHQRAIDAGDPRHGVSVHFVTEELDGGPVIAQASVAIENGDTPETLAVRVSIQEHRIYPRVVSWFADKRLQMQGNSALLDNKLLPANGADSRST